MSLKRVAVVTGSNKGIGYSIVKFLCKKFDGIVYLTARDESRGKNAVHELFTNVRSLTELIECNHAFKMNLN